MSRRVSYETYETLSAAVSNVNPVSGLIWYGDGQVVASKRLCYLTTHYAALHIIFRMYSDIFVSTFEK